MGSMMGRRWKLVLVIIAIVGGGVVAWQRFHSPLPPLPVANPPGIPDSLVDPELRAVLTKARERVIGDPRSENVWGDLGLLFRAHKLFEESIACFGEASKLNPANPRWPYLIGNLKLRLEPEGAIPYLRAAYSVSTEPGERSATRLQLADALLDRDELDEATGLYREELSRNSQNPRSHYGLGAAAFSRGDPAVAIDHLLIAASSPSSRQMASALLATCYSQLGRTSEAKRFEQEAARPPLDQPWPDPLDSGAADWQVGSDSRERMLGGLRDQGRNKEVIRALREIVRDHPEDQMEMSLGIEEVMAGEWLTAEKVLRKALAKNPDHATGRCFLGLSLYYQALFKWQSGNRGSANKLFEAALAEFRKSYELKPDMGQAHLFAGCSLKYLGRLPEAVEECRMVIRAMPQSSDAHYTLGELLHEQGKSEEAVPCLEDAARLAPANDNRAKTLLQKIRSNKAR
jgi:tetratricopeptide (TPR) repeat protein